MSNDIYAEALTQAIAQARLAVDEGGMPFGAALVVDGEIVSLGRNRQIPDSGYFAHAEVKALTDHVKKPYAKEAGAVLVATEAPCIMCCGTALVSGISKVIVGEDVHFAGGLDVLRNEGVEVEVLGNEECIAMVGDFIAEHEDRWNFFSA